MDKKEIIKLIEQMKIVNPTISIPELKGLSDEEQYNKLSIYIMAFGKLDYLITLKAIQKIMLDEKLLKEFKHLPIPTLARESVKLTEFSEKEKETYKNSKHHYFVVEILNKKMLAINKATGKREVENDRPMTSLEEDYWIKYMMSEEEYKYHKGLLDYTPERLIYNPRKRTIEV